MSRPTPISTYSVDGSAPETFRVAEVPQEALYRQRFYQSPTLEDKEHVLIVTSTVSESEFWLDYLQLSHTIPPVPSTNTLVSSITSSGPSSTVTTPIIHPQSSSFMPTTNTSIISISTFGQSSMTPTIHPQPSTTEDGESLSSTSSNTKSARINKGLIAGATVGGIVIIVLVTIIIWAIFRRKGRRSSSLNMNSAQPFVHSNRAQIFFNIFTQRLPRFVGMLGDWTPSLSVSEQNTRCVALCLLTAPSDIQLLQ